MAELRYRAWGETRYAWGATPTDYRFSGQREEGALGLYFYNARWYDPVLGRFIQADTLAPEPGNPLDWDRYAYVHNNPVLFTDPSGHWICKGANNCTPNLDHTLSGDELLDRLFNQYNVSCSANSMSHNNRRSVALGVTFVGGALVSGMPQGMTSSQAFQAVYGGVTFDWGNCPECNGGGGYTYGAHLIRFASLSDVSEQRRVNNIVHELGHAFDWVIAGLSGENATPRNVLDRC